MASATSRDGAGRIGAWSRPCSAWPLLGGLPAAVALPGCVVGQNYSFEVRWTLAAVVLAVWIGCAAAAYQMVTRVLYLAANLLGALHEGDYSIRATGAKPGSAVDLVMKEINSLGNTLQRQRSEAVESTALLTSVMGAIDVAVFAFDMDERLVLANPAAERLLSTTSPELLGRDAGALRLERYLTGDSPRLIEAAFGPSSAASNCAARRSIATASPTSCSSSPISAARCARSSSRPGSASSACCRTRSTTRSPRSSRSRTASNG